MRRLLCGALLVSLGAWWVACSDASTGPPPPAPLDPNRPPTAVGAIQGQSAMVGDTVALTVSSYFADPDGDRLLYDARSSDPGVATVSAAGDTVTVVAVRRGAAAITVTASDPDGPEASQPFELTVLNSGPAAPGRIPDLELPLGQEATAEVSPSMLRRGEAAALTWADVEFWSDGSARVTVRRSKSDQDGNGATLYVGRDAATELRAIHGPDASPGAPVFGLRTGKAVSKRIGKAARAAGLVGRFSGHSPRIGMARDLVASGAGVAAVQVAGRWASPQMPSYYARAELAGDGAVARFYGEE
ncbi:tyrosine-type recombinase/integrase [Candidatus Palauibacter sp.]|uniref:tyrosine-type recombinase/integrase n=1 Tax=Candidatus Palauibacter sp. TaxID=3101350 RepID=UPI003B5A4C82